MAEFSPISENFTPTGPSPEVSWESSLTIPVQGYVDTDLTGSFDSNTSDEPYAFPSISGAAVSVEQSLSKISFVPGTSGQMSSAIAYIRYWSRKGTQRKTAVESNPVNGAVSDPQDALLSQINDLSYGTDLDLGPTLQPSPQPGPALTIPTNTAYQSRPRQPLPTSTSSSSGLSALNRLGSIFSANPGGVTAPAWTNPFASQSSAPSPDNAVWQFLFNPEELQLSSGPDFNRAETWGVSDPANSGQPLSWRSNKNRKLTFGKVLLHGYTFGRRVDSLERGLQQLFEARDGENGADGPPVLEFVWGQRVFGPCVIQNIQVREKAWDKGLLVNAEVSFELEQVPEWTINDEFVDVLRPGRQSTVNDPTVASEEYRDTAAGDTGTNIPTPATKPGGGGGDPKATPKSGLLTKCQEAARLRQEFYTKVEGLVSTPFARNKNNILSARSNYSSLYDYSVNTLGKDFTKYIKSPITPVELYRITEFQIKKAEESAPAASPPDYKNAYLSVQSAANSARLACKAFSESKQCKDTIKEANVLNKEAAKNKDCDKRKLGATCSSAGKTIVTCSGIRLICNGSTYQLPSSIR